LIFIAMIDVSFPICNRAGPPCPAPFYARIVCRQYDTTAKWNYRYDDRKVASPARVFRCSQDPQLLPSTASLQGCILPMYPRMRQIVPGFKFFVMLSTTGEASICASTSLSRLRHRISTVLRCAACSDFRPRVRMRWPTWWRTSAKKENLR